MTSFTLDVLAITALVAAVLVITAGSPVASIMYLIGVFIVAACYLVCLGVPFMGLTYLVVYVGAVAVLFMFVVMMLNVRLSEVVDAGTQYTKGLPLGLIMAAVFLYAVQGVMAAGSTGTGTRGGELAMGVLHWGNSLLVGGDVAGSTGPYLAFATIAPDATFVVGGVSQIEALGLSLYTYGSLWLMMVSVILLLAMMGPIALCMRQA